MSQQIETKVIFPVGAKAQEQIAIDDVKPTSQNGILSGKAHLPTSAEYGKVLIYQQGDDLRVISAYCPHQNYDISKDPIKPDGNVYCSLHKRPICLYSEYNQAFKVELRGQKYIIPAG